MKDSTSAALAEQLGSWMEGYRTLKAETEELRRRNAHVGRQLEEASAQGSLWREEAQRQMELLKVKQASVEQHTSLLALMRCVDEAAPIAAAGEPTERQVRELEQRLALRDAELQALQTRVRDVEQIQQRLVDSRAEADQLRTLLKAEQLVTAPLRADVEERKRVNRLLRDQLGKSQIERERQRSEFQAELTSLGKRLRVSKSQSEALQRVLQDQPRQPGRVGAPTTAFGASAAAYPW